MATTLFDRQTLFPPPLVNRPPGGLRARSFRCRRPSAAIRYGLVLAIAVLASACGGTDGQGGREVPGDAVEGPVLVFAAASLTNAFGDLEAAFELANTGVDIQLSTAGSSSLREQILAGAPADVFASANESNMAIVADANEVATSPIVFVTNTLEIAVPTGNPGNITALSDLAREPLLVGLCAKAVPCGSSALDVLRAAGVEASVDTNEPDVRSLLTKIENGELDAGVVYATDVLASNGQVEGIAIPDEVNVETGYPIARLSSGPNPTAAEAFVVFVLSGEGQAILTDHGFLAT